jgi:hypothetical protein
MKIIIETIPHVEQRYPTVGDWYFKRVNPDGTESDLDPREAVECYQQCSMTLNQNAILYIKVSTLQDWRKVMLIAVHELVEVALCISSGVTQDQVDRFDMQYEELRKPGDESEPGDACLAPYRDQHCYATAVERMLCAAFGLSWLEYEREIGSLYDAEVASGQNKETPDTCSGEVCAPETAEATVQPVVSEMGGSSEAP